MRLMARKRKGDTGGSRRWVRNGLRWQEGMGLIEKRNGEKSKRQEEGLMGTYLNPGNGLFKIALNSQIFVDKSRLLEVTNRCVGTMQKFVCVSRSRRFGKSMVDGGGYAGSVLSARDGFGSAVSGAENCGLCFLFCTSKSV